VVAVEGAVRRASNGIYAVLEQVLDLLRCRGRVSYRALKAQFSLDDDYLEALKDELIDAQRLARDEDGRDLDPEAAQRLLDPAIQGMMDAVHRYEGTVNQVLGDGA
jgi:hypothetical protein